MIPEGVATPHLFCHDNRLFITLPMTTKKPLPAGITRLSYKLEAYAICTKIQECKITYYATVQDVSQLVYNSKYVLEVAFDKENGKYEPCYPPLFSEPCSQEVLEWVINDLNKS